MRKTITKVALSIITTAHFVSCEEVEKVNHQKTKPPQAKQIQTDLQKLKIKGKVKKINETQYEILTIPAQKALDKLDSINTQTANPVSRFVKSFNEKGNQTTLYVYDEFGNLEGKNSYQYDEKGNKTELKLYDANNQLTSRDRYGYDQQGNQIESNTYDQQESLVLRYAYTYDKKGNQIKCLFYHADECLDGKYTYEYDDHNNQIVWNMYRADGHLEIKHTYEYDSQNNIQQENSYHADGTLAKTSIHQYHNNRLTQTDSYHPHDKLSTKVTYEYAYDAQQNWIMRKEYENDQAIELIEREITYY